MGTMATGAKEPGWQAAVDDALSTAASVLAGADMMSGAGLLDGSRTLSYPHLVMETEVYRIVQRLAEGIAVDDETLALEAIGRVGPGGTYLADPHTRRHARDIWRPAVWDRSPYDAWLAGGRRGAFDEAAEIAAGDPRRPPPRAAAGRPGRRARGHRRARRSPCSRERAPVAPGHAALARGPRARVAADGPFDRLHDVPAACIISICRTSGL